jgi:type I restriction enzyme S subunit
MRNMTDDLFARASGGTATDNLNTGDFSSIEIFTPPETIIHKYDNLVKDYFDKIYINQIQIRTLSRFRDMLLPKLMSGEVRVKL